MDNIIITRHKDNCALCKKLVMIDSTEAIYGIHVGVTGFRLRTATVAEENKEWNMMVYKRMKCHLKSCGQHVFSLSDETVNQGIVFQCEVFFVRLRS